jgi:hypothetical protein
VLSLLNVSIIGAGVPPTPPVATAINMGGSTRPGR